MAEYEPFGADVKPGVGRFALEFAVIHTSGAPGGVYEYAGIAVDIDEEPCVAHVADFSIVVFRFAEDDVCPQSHGLAQAVEHLAVALADAALLFVSLVGGMD